MPCQGGGNSEHDIYSQQFALLKRHSRQNPFQYQIRTCNDKDTENDIIIERNRGRIPLSGGIQNPIDVGDSECGAD